MTAVPGEITSSLSAGTNALLRLGATPVTSAVDVLESLGITPPAKRPESRHPLLELMPATADELARRSGLGAADLAAQLAALELDALTGEADGIYRALGP